MSVAGELAKLRRGALAAGAGAHVPSVLHDARAARLVPRAEAAGAALNGLESLSAGDAALPLLAGPLLLHGGGGRGDRATLAPDAEAAVSLAVVHAAHRLAPVFPLRAAQKVVEWVVRGLEAGRLGADAEVDALLVAALPFHATDGFVRLAAALLAPPARPRPAWRWLRPAVEQRLPPAEGFVVRHAAPAVFRLALRQAAASALAGIAAQHLNAFVARVVSRRLLAREADALERRTLALAALQALCFKRRHFNVVAGKRAKGQPRPPAVVRAVNRAKGALLIVLATAVAAGVDAEVREAVLHGAVDVIVCKDADAQTRAAGASCLVLCLASVGYAGMPPPLARKLAKWGQFPEVLARLRMEKGGREAYAVYLAALARMSPSDRKSLVALRDGLSVKRDALLCPASIEKVVVALLDSFSPPENQEDEENFRVQALTETLVPIARGAHSPALDTALRRHFDGRQRKKTAASRFDVVDKALAEALAGTPYVTVKTAGHLSGGAMTQDTLFNCLEHPEPSVRLAGLSQLSKDTVLLENAKGKPLADRIRDILMRRLTIESDLRVVTKALETGLVIEFCHASDAVQAVVKRYCEQFAGRLEQTQNKQMKHFVLAAFSFCCAAVSAAASSSLLRINVRAFFLGLSLDNVLPTQETISTLPDVPDFAKLWTSNFDILPSDVGRTITALFSWHNSWGTMYVENHFSTVKIEMLAASEYVQIVSATFKLIMESDLEDSSRTLMVKTVLGSLDRLSGLADDEVGHLNQLWLDVAKCSSPKILKLLVAVICATHGTNRLHLFLKSASEDATSSHASRVALQWRVAMFKARPQKNDQVPLVRYLLMARYSSDETARKLAANICAQMEAGDMDAASSDSARILLGMKDTSETPIEGKTDGEDRVGLELVNHLNMTFPKLTDIPKPLPEVRAEKSQTFEAILNLAKPFLAVGTSVEYLAAVCRSLPKVSVTSHSSISFLLGTLKALLSSDSPVFESELRTEVFIRLIVKIPWASDLAEIPSEAPSVGRLLVHHSNSLKSIATSPTVALYGMAVTAGLLKFADILRKPGHTSENIKAVARDAVSGLFCISNLSSSIGSYSSKLIHSHAHGVIISDDFERVADFLNDTLPTYTQKRRRTRNAAADVAVIEDAISLIDFQGAATGALEVLARLNVPGDNGLVSTTWKVSSSVLGSMWMFVRNCVDTSKTENSAKVEDCEYQLSVVLRVLANHFRCQNEASGNLALSTEDAIATVDMCFYPSMDCEREVSVVESGIRAASIVLLECLAQTYSGVLREHVVPFLKHVLSSESIPSGRESFAKIVALLLKGGFSVSEFMKLALAAKSSSSSNGGLSVTDCIRMCPDRKAATSAALNIVSHSDMKPHVNIILQSGNTIEDVLSVLIDLRSSIIAETSVNVLGHPDFLLQLDAHLQEISGAQDESPEAVPDFSHLNALFLKLFQNILPSEEKLRQSSLCTLLAIVPARVIRACLQYSIQSPHEGLSLRGVQGVIQRFEVNSPIPSNWEGSSGSPAQHQADREVFQNMCSDLRLLISLSVSSKTTQFPQVGLAAIVALHKVILRAGTSCVEELQVCGGALSTVLKSKQSNTVVSSTILCLSSIARILGKSGAVFVPLLSSTAISVMEDVLGPPKSGEGLGGGADVENTSSTICLNSAAQVCAEVLEISPSMFGKKVLRRIAALAVTVDHDMATDLLTLAVTKVSPVQALEGLSAALEIAKNSTDGDVCRGIEIVMNSGEKLVQCLRKNQVKKLKIDILQLCLSGLEHRSLSVSVTSGHSEDDVMQADKVEEACYTTLTELILRVPESEFKVMFNKISNWSKVASLPEPHSAILKSFGVEAPENILRFIPLQGLCVRLFTILRGIMCPYFSVILEESLDVIGSKQAPKAKLAAKSATLSSSKKRKRRDESEEEREFALTMESLRAGLVKSSLEGVELFLRHISDEDEVSTSTLGRIQNSVLIAFDAYGKETAEVERALCALAQRIMVTGAYRTKDQSRELLCALSRAILQRAGSEAMQMRKASLVVAASVVDAVGGEYLVALPEAMPVLADVVDDEKDEVAKAGKNLVAKFEGLSGEPILEQLK